MDHALYATQTTLDNTMDSESKRPEFTYKMSETEMSKFIKLRVTNSALFTGRKFSSKLAWRAILREMGLQDTLSTSQANKKWENLKNKYKEMKNPPPGVVVNPTNWRWFRLMDDAMEGRLAESEVLVSTSSLGNDRDLLLHNRPRKRTRVPQRSEIEFLISGDDTMDSAEQDSFELNGERDDLEQERAALESERVTLENEKTVLEREKMVLDRERAGLEREQAALDRDRASLERDKAATERQRAAVERDHAQLEKERAALERDRAWLERDRAALQRGTGSGARLGTEEVAHDRLKALEGTDKTDTELEQPSMERRQKFLSLFEKLIENF